MAAGGTLLTGLGKVATGAGDLFDKGSTTTTPTGADAATASADTSAPADRQPARPAAPDRATDGPDPPDRHLARRRSLDRRLGGRVASPQVNIPAPPDPSQAQAAGADIEAQAFRATARSGEKLAQYGEQFADQYIRAKLNVDAADRTADLSKQLHEAEFQSSKIADRDAATADFDARAGQDPRRLCRPGRQPQGARRRRCQPAQPDRAAKGFDPAGGVRPGERRPRSPS